MQDREEQLFDKEFVDRAWQQMHQLLDKEMPVRRRSRRLLWLMALGFVFLCSGGMIFGPASNLDYPRQLVGPYEVADQENDPASPDPLAEAKEEKINSREKNTAQSGLQQNQNNPTNGQKPTQPLTGPQAKDRSSISSARNAEVESPLIFSQKEEGATESSSDEPSRKNTSHEQVYTSEAQVESDISLVEKQESNSRSVASLDFLLRSKELEWPLREMPESIEFKSKVRPFAASWSFGVHAGVLSSQLPDVNGGSIGVWGQRPRFFSNRLSLRIGLQYALERVSPVVQSASSGEPDLATESSDPTSFPLTGRRLDSLSAVAVANSLDLNIHRFQLPVSLRWRAGNRLQVLGGMQLTYRRAVVRENTDQHNVSLGGNNYSQAYNDLLLLDSGAALPMDNINRWDLGWHLGAAYSVTPRLEAVFTYQHGFRNLFNGLDLEIYNRNANVGLSYRF